MNVRLTAFGLDALARGLKQMPDYTRAELLGAMTEATTMLGREVQEVMPKVSKLTAASVTSDAFSTPAGVLGVVGSAQVSAAVLEEGRKPGSGVSPAGREAIAAWAQQKFGVSAARATGIAFVVARNIKQRGLPAKRPFARTLDAQLGALEVLFEAAARRVADRLAGDVNGSPA